MRGFFYFFSIITLVVILVDVYAFMGVRQLTQDLDPFWRKTWRLLFWLPTAVTMILFAFLYFGMDEFVERRNYAFFYFVTGFSILFLIPKLLFVVFHFADDITHFFRWIFFSLRTDSTASPDQRMTRVQFFNQVGLGVSALAFGALLYGLTRGKFAYRVLKESLTFNDLPESFRGLRIVHISDAHLGSFLNDSFEEVDKGLQMINDLKPDLIFFTGDLVNNFAHEAEPWIPYFNRLEARLGKFSILGNHDYGDYVYSPKHPEDAEKRTANLNRLKEIHGEMGFRLLLNEHVKLTQGDDSIVILGMENWGRGRFSKYGDLARTMEGIEPDTFRILLSHDPTHWEDQVMGKEKIHLTLSGHTHGSQMGLEAPMLNIKVSPSPMFGYKRWAGLYEEFGQYLYVNRGFGFLGFPGRVGMPPEITVIEMEKA